MRADESAPALAGWLARLEARPPARRDDLSELCAVAERLGVCTPARASVVVAGTNGKGSTVAFLEALLLASGRSVATTTSPHLHRFNERVRVNGRCASDAALVDALEAVESACAGAALSYFDHATLAALLLITRARPDVAILEVGLGGRLDAVNVVDGDVAVITNIGLDHQRQLGSTREAIAKEKAGVARPGRPVVVGEATPPATLLDTAGTLQAPMRLAERDFGHGKAHLWLRDGQGCAKFPYAASAVDAENAATALQAAALLGGPPTPEVVAAAAAAVVNPGRFEIVRRGERVWVLDAAHNPAAARFLAERLRSRFRGRRLAAMIGCMAEKDAAGIVAPLKPLLANGELAFADTRPPRGQSAHATRRTAGEPNAFAGSLAAAVAHVEERSPPNRVILVCGSFDLIERMHVRLHLVAADGSPPAPCLTVAPC